MAKLPAGAIGVAFSKPCGLRWTCIGHTVAAKTDGRDVRQPLWEATCSELGKPVDQAKPKPAHVRRRTSIGENRGPGRMKPYKPGMPLPLLAEDVPIRRKPEADRVSRAEIAATPRQAARRWPRECRWRRPAPAVPSASPAPSRPPRGASRGPVFSGR